MELTSILELGVDEAYAILVGRFAHANLPPLEAIEYEDWGREFLMSQFEGITDEDLARVGLMRDSNWD